MDREFKIGDKVRIHTWLGDSIVTINRITKTQAIADVFEKDGKTKRYSYKFKRFYQIYDESDTRIFPHPVPRIEWNTNEYFLMK